MQSKNLCSVLFLYYFTLSFHYVIDMDDLTLSGHYVPQLSQIVHQRNKGIQNPVINFKGFLVRK